ncbi:MAG: alcohol dehydrogenase catalytic domain-containing protein [Candidatus Bathyarchaeota archaeon]|nr:alcohol dehydrogenase catalytic domain-containing protein [Candidatus Bathyarchaeota archaeon]
MKGIVYEGDRVARVRRFLIPKPGKREVLVRVKATTICGSDMHKWRMSKDRARAAAWFSFIHGHEGAGVVEEVGEAVDYLKKGDRVMIYHTQGCGVCPKCLEGQHRLCEMGEWRLSAKANGTFAEYVLNRETSVRKMPDFLSFFDGAMMGCCAGTAFEALRKLRVNSRTTLVVYGLGPVGLCAVIEGKVLGAHLIGVDVREERVNFGSKYGCDEVVNASRENPVEAVMRITSNRGADAVLETSGSAFLNAVNSAKRNDGRVCVVGFGSDSVGVPEFHTGLLHDRYVVGSSLFPIQSIQELMDLLMLHNTHLDQIVDTVYKLDQAQEAHEQFETYRSAKIGFTP